MSDKGKGFTNKEETEAQQKSQVLNGSQNVDSSKQTITALRLLLPKAPVVSNEPNNVKTISFAKPFEDFQKSNVTSLPQILESNPTPLTNASTDNQLNKTLAVSNTPSSSVLDKTNNLFLTQGYLFLKSPPSQILPTGLINSTDTSGLNSEMPVLNNPSSSGERKRAPKGMQETDLAVTEKLFEYEKLCRRQKAIINAYQHRIKTSQRKFYNLKSHLRLVTKGSGIFRIFNKDQVLAMQKKSIGKSTKFIKWTDTTFLKALRIKFTCGVEGYREILKQGIPLPTEKTMQRRVQRIKFESGILNQVFDFLKIKIDSFGKDERDCCLILEEMEIVNEKIYDIRPNFCFDSIIVPESRGNATHVQIFVLAGINARWKQIVAYYFTEGSIERHAFENILLDIFHNAKEINLNIISITSDIDSNNQAIWDTLELDLTRQGIFNNTIDHLLDPSKKIFIFADVPTIFKQFKLMLIMNKTIIIPEDLQEKYNLPTNIISSHHITDLISLQTVFRFRLVPKPSFADLLPYDLDKLAAFKPKVKNVQNVDISDALKLVAKLNKKIEYLTTAWFIDILTKWFDIMTAKSPATALSKLNEETFNENLRFLNEFIDIIDQLEIKMEVDVSNTTKIGTLISTKSMIQLQQSLLNHKNFFYLLSSRFFSNYLENLFNVLKAKNVSINARNIEKNLKTLCVAQYLKCPRSSMLDEDDRSIFQRCHFVGVTQADNHNEVVRHYLNVEPNLFAENNPKVEEENPFEEIDGCGFSSENAKGSNTQEEILHSPVQKFVHDTNLIEMYAGVQDEEYEEVINDNGANVIYENTRIQEEELYSQQTTQEHNSIKYENMEEEILYEEQN